MKAFNPVATSVARSGEGVGGHVDFMGGRGQWVVWCSRGWRAVVNRNGEVLCDNCGADLSERIHLHEVDAA